MVSILLEKHAGAADLAWCASERGAEAPSRGLDVGRQVASMSVLAGFALRPWACAVVAQWRKGWRASASWSAEKVLKSPGMER